MRLREKLRLIWAIIRRHELIVFDPKGIYGNSVIVTKFANTTIPDIQRILRETMHLRIPKAYWDEGFIEFNAKETMNEIGTIYSIKYYPPSIAAKLVDKIASGALKSVRELEGTSE
jgi:hypothetical protein